MNQILCSLKNINLSSGIKILLKEASLIIHQEDQIGLIGLNGTGKSSLFQIIDGSLIPDTSVPPFQFDKATSVNNLTEPFSAFLVPQELPVNNEINTTIKGYIYNFYPKLKSINQQLIEINRLLDKVPSPQLLEEQKSLLDQFEHLRGWEITRTYESFIRHFGIADINLLIKDLSGGEQKKVLLSLGFSSPANLILWDEPTNHIDLETIDLFEHEIMEQKKAFMIVTHDRYLLSRLTKIIFHIKQGKIQSFVGNYADYLEYLSNYEQSKQKSLERLRNNLRRETDWMRQGIKARGTRSKKRVESYHNLQQKINDLKSQTKKLLDLNISKSKRETKKLVDLNEVSFNYPSKKTLLENINCSIIKNDKIGLLGPNGIGKTTLINLIIGDLLPTSGNVKRADNLTVQYFSQKRDELDQEKSPYQLLGDGGDIISLPNGQKKHVSGYFSEFLFDKSDLHRPIKTFSGGEKNRLQLALNLKKSGDLLIFDEPTNDLDLETLQILEEKLVSFEGSILLITHDRAFLNAVTNKIWLVDDNTIEIFEGGYGQVQPYLDALNIEKLINMAKKPGESESQGQSEKEVKGSRSKNTRPTKLTNHDKNRLKNISLEIENLEKSLKNKEMEIANFNFLDMNERKHLDFHQINETKAKIENDLINLYEELEYLKGKS